MLNKYVQQAIHCQFFLINFTLHIQLLSKCQKYEKIPKQRKLDMYTHITVIIYTSLSVLSTNVS